MGAAVLAFVLACAGCGEGVDTADLPASVSIDGYEQWTEVDFTNEVPGHGDSYRKVFINPTARSYPHGGRYPVGSVLVKEIYDKTDEGQPGDLRYIAIMRKIQDPEAFAEQPDIDAPTDGNGWLFTKTGSRGGSEEHYGACWTQCHKQAPYDGAWFDYGF